LVWVYSPRSGDFALVKETVGNVLLDIEVPQLLNGDGGQAKNLKNKEL